jgi:DNA (cytosine-5)-methyltransferase 1
MICFDKRNLSLNSLHSLSKEELLELLKPSKNKLTTKIKDICFDERQDKKYYYDDNVRYADMLKSAVKKKNTIYQLRRIYVRENKNELCPTLTANMGTGGHNVPLIKDSYGIRKLTPRECLRFQGFSDDFTLPENMANSHIYKQAGNSVSVPVIEKIADNIKKILDNAS